MLQNSVTLKGRLTADPVVTKTKRPDGSELARADFQVAIDMGKNAKGEKLTQFIPCKAWNKLAETIAKYSHKGDLIDVGGYAMYTHLAKDDGTKTNIFYVNVENVLFAPKSASPAAKAQTEAPVEAVADDERIY